MDRVSTRRKARIAIMLWILFKKYNNRQKFKSFRRIWVHPINAISARRAQGDYDNLINEMRLSDPNKFFNHLRMKPELFDNLLGLVNDKISKYSWRDSISPSIRLALTLRYLASGDLMISIARQFRVGESTVSQIIKETCDAIWDTLKELVFISISKESWQNIAEGYNQKWQFPNCIGAIDGKHVVIQAPPNAGSTFYNYKGAHSIVLMAVCDYNYNFTLVDIGAHGRDSDGGIFRHSAIGNNFINDKMNLPPPALISPHRPKVPFVLVGDEAFALTTFLMRPYPGKAGLSKLERIFNYRLSRARRTIENSFGILAARWRIFRKPIQASLKTIDSIVKATVCLHNFVKKSEENLPVQQRLYCPKNYADYNLPNGTLIRGTWRQVESNGLRTIGRSGSNTYSQNASTVRNIFKNYFNNEGTISFQDERAGVL